MIYDVILSDSEVSLVGSVKFEKDLTRLKFVCGSHEFVLDRDEVTNKIELVRVETVGDSNAQGPERYVAFWQINKVSDGSVVSKQVPEDCLVDLAAVLGVVGTKVFSWGSQTNAVVVHDKETDTHFCTYEYSRNMDRFVVYKHPKDGAVFTLAADETTYKKVEDYDAEPALEQARRLQTAAGIPRTWLYREVKQEGDEVVYRSLSENYFDFKSDEKQ